MKTKCYQQKKHSFIYETFYTNLRVTTKINIKYRHTHTKKKLRKISQKTIKPKWQTETKGKRNSGDIELPENKR